MTKPMIAALSAAGVIGSDPFAEFAARLLSEPLRQLYALLWRAGLIEIADDPRDRAAHRRRAA